MMEGTFQQLLVVAGVGDGRGPGPVLGCDGSQVSEDGLELTLPQLIEPRSGFGELASSP
jgi:hypothetical protein